jgi:hypothetical protein
MLISASSLVIVFALGLGSMLSQTNSNGGASPTVDESWQSTLAAIIAAKTAYAKVYPSPTLTSTSTPDVTRTVVQETRNARTPETLEMTASYIVQQATDQAAIAYTKTANAIFGIPLSSRTFLPANTIMPTPTDTAAELERQKAEYITEIRAVVGFTHPIFDEIAQQFVDENRTDGRGHLQLDTRAIFFQNVQYIALIIRREGDSPLLWHSYLVLFRSSDHGMALLDNDLGYYLTMGFDEYGFTDRNKNGLPDLTVYAWNGGKCCPFELHIFEIKPTHQIEEISPWTTDVYPIRFIDLDNDGIPEIEGQEGTVGAYNPMITRWFGWNGQAYVDISRQHPELYLSRINDFAQGIASDCDRFPPVREEMEYYLANFYAMGRLSDGWSELQRILKLHCSADELQRVEGVLKEVEQWMNSLPKS